MKADMTRSTFDPHKHYKHVRMQQGRVQLDADWNEQLDIAAHHEETELLDIVGRCGAPMDNAGFAIGIQSGNLSIGAGRYYVDGILCENEALLLFTEQSDLPGITLPIEEGIYLAYLDVWSHHITALEDTEIREVALGGPDTATRLKTVWQVKLVQVGELEENIHCLSELSAWNDVIESPDGKLAARAEPDATSSSPCIIPPGAGYRRLENQLYRVEVHTGGALGTATFKWSRDNGSIVAKWESQDGNNLTVTSAGRDKVLNFASGQWIELTDDKHELQGLAGTLVKLTKVEGQVLTIDPATATGTTTLADFPTNPKIRRWDSEGLLTPVNSDWIDLEDGVQIQVTAGSYKTGDYWLIPARTATTDVEWPLDPITGEPATESPAGIVHHYCRLALLQLDDASWSLLSDCRELFPPVTELTSLFYVSGDGQEVMPDPTQLAQLLPLAQPLQVGVANGSHPVEGATVRFSVVAGSGGLQGAGVSVDILTDASGIATCAWSLDSTTHSQQVKATLLDAASEPVHLPVIFTANLSQASDVAYSPGACAALESTKTVQEAIDQLCQKMITVEPGIKIRAVEITDGQPLLNDIVVSVDKIFRGIFVRCDGTVDPTSVKRPTCYVTLEIPFPLTPQDQEFWGRNRIGYERIVLDATVRTEGEKIEWVPTSLTQAWLEVMLFRRVANERPGILARLTLKGNFIWGVDTTGNRLYLDGEVYGVPRRDGTTGLNIEDSGVAGDGRRGGDFEMWFWLGPPSETRGALTITSITANPSNIVGGSPVDFTVTLSEAAPAGGFLVNLTSSVLTVVTVPESIMVDEGTSSKTFSVIPASFTTRAVKRPRITATANDSSVNTTLTVRPAGG